MEAAPLSLAYSHARNAATELHKSNPTAASEEHDLAAGEFANAAKVTGDPEALRTLRLLEQHHQRLAELLKFKPGPPRATDATEEGPLAEALSTVAEKEDDAVSEKKPAVAARQTGKGSDRSHRELSSSIATNLASARGIQPRQRPRTSQPSTTLNTTNADGRMLKEADGGDLSASRRTSRGYDRRPPPLSPSSTFKSRHGAADASGASPTRSHIPPSVLETGSDDAFARFYNTVETIGTKLSAALAFTGLPLGSQEAETNPEAPATAQKAPVAARRQRETRAPQLPRDKSRTTPSGSPDVSRFFSPAALKAVREDTGAAVAESFYVVPTSGGTVSYRDMLSTAGQTGRQGSGLSNVDEAEEFVDAREVPGTASFEGVKPARHSRSRANTAKGLSVGDEKAQQDTLNELTHWKALAMETGERLRAFEMNAQRESIMHASMFRATSQPPGLKRDSTRGSADDKSRIQELEVRLAELQGQVEKEGEENHRLSKENKKLEAVLSKYRKKFEELKDSARERMRREDTGRARNDAEE